MPTTKREEKRKGTSKLSKEPSVKVIRRDIIKMRGCCTKVARKPQKRSHLINGRVATTTTYAQAIRTYNTIYDQEAKDIFATVEYMKHTLIPVD